MKENPNFFPGRDIVVSVVDAMKAELRALVIETEGTFTIDLTGVEMIDSKGLGLLIATNNSLVSQGRQLRIIQANDDLIDLFRMMRLDRHFVIDERK